MSRRFGHLGLTASFSKRRCAQAAPVGLISALVVVGCRSISSAFSAPLPRLESSSGSSPKFTTARPATPPSSHLQGSKVPGLGRRGGQRTSQVRLHESAMSMVPSTASRDKVESRVLERKEVKFVQQQRLISAGAAALASGFFFWYAANVSFNVVNKHAVGLFPHAWTVSVIQLATVVLCSVVGWMSGIVASPFKAMGPGFLWRLMPAALFHAAGNGLTCVAFSWGSVSFTHVIKTSEPVWMALGNFMLNGSALPTRQFLALVPIMCGVALASAGELSFSWVGFLAALGSTVAFAGRGIFSKRLMSGGEAMSPLNVYAMDSLLALLFTLPVAALTDGPALLSGTMFQVVASHGATLLSLLAATGLAYYAYNAVAFQLLGRLDVVSHAVGNLGKRIFVIGFSVLAFSTPLSGRAIAGSLVAILGSGLYSYVKATSGHKHLPEKERPEAACDRLR